MPSYSWVKEMILQEDGSYKVSGLIPDILEAMRVILNFTYTVKQPPDKSWGSVNENGDWNGMVRQLIDGQSDIGDCSHNLPKLQCT